MTLIRGEKGGGKGGGGSAHTPTEQPDSLRSKQYARVLDLVSEGEIVGLVNGLQSVFLDDTPVQNPDGSNNFSGVTVSTKEGTQAQTYLPGFPETETVKPVSVTVTADTSVTRSITNSNITDVRVTIGVPSLIHQQTNGDLVGSSFGLAIDLQADGGGFAEIKTDTVSGKTTSRYQRSYRIALTGSAPWDIRIRRTTADSGGAQTTNAFHWDTYTEIIDQKLSHPNSALIGLEIDSSQFDRIPQRGYEMDLLKIRIPDNYDPVTREYTGSWGGSFATAWSDNPAWCFYDMLTMSRYGLGDFLAAGQVDKWTLYTIGQYCDTLVDNGSGGQEPRFTCNLYLQTRDEALSVIAAMASIFRGMLWYSGGAITAGQDAPADSIYHFTAANVLDGVFNYSGSALRARHTVALVTWNDPTDRYRQKVEYVEDQAGIALYGIRETEITAIGCTSRGQAHRAGKWLLFSERLETETVSFRAGLDGTAVYPGAIIETQDQHRAGARFGGRVSSATTSAVTIDSSVTLEGGETYTLGVILPDGSLESTTVTDGAGARTVLNLSPALSDTPQDNALWVLTASNLVPETWRVVAVSEVEPNIIEVTALEHVSGKYDLIESDIALEQLPVSFVHSQPDSPTNLEASEALYEPAPGVAANRIFLSWKPVEGHTYFRIEWKRDNDNVRFTEVQENSYDIEPGPAGTYVIKVIGFNALDYPSVPAELTQVFAGLTIRPAAPQNMTMVSLGGLALIRWDQATELDVRVGGEIEFRHSPLTTGASWGSATSIGDQIPGDSTTVTLPLLTGTYLAKARDASNNYSIAAGSVSTDGATALEWANTTSISEHTTFSGSHTNTVGASSILKLDGFGYVDDIADVDAVADWDGEGGVQSSGTYDFSAGIDLTTVTRCRVSKVLSAIIVNTDDLIDSRTDDIDDWPDFEGDEGTEADATVWVRTTDDDPAGTPTWSDWQRLDSAEYENRAFDFQARLISNEQTHNIHIDELGAVVDELV